MDLNYTYTLDKYDKANIDTALFLPDKNSLF